MNDKPTEFTGGDWIKGNKPKQDGRYFIKKGINYKDVLFFFKDGKNLDWEDVTHWLQEYTEDSQSNLLK